MRVLLTAATALELQPVLDTLGTSEELGDLELISVVTGIGVVATAVHTLRAIYRYQPEIVVGLGIAGSYDHAIPLGTVFKVDREQQADMGIEHRDGRIVSIFDAGLEDRHQWPYQDGWLLNPHDLAPALESIDGITRQITTGARQPEPLRALESMEGAGFFYSCLVADVRFIQLRAVSNYVGPRDRDSWRIELALSSLSHVCREMMECWMKDAVDDEKKS